MAELTNNSKKLLNFFLNLHGYRFIAIGAIFISILSGKLSLDRLFGTGTIHEWLQIRFWFFLISAILCLLSLRKIFKSKSGMSRDVIIILISLFGLYAYFGVNALLLGKNTSYREFYLENLFVIATAMILIILFDDEKDIGLWAVLSEILGIFLICLSLIGYGDPELNGPAWAPIGGPITFYRIEFLSVCSALYLSSRMMKAKPLLSICHIIIAGMCLFATFASLSKVAYYMSLATLGLIILACMIRKEYREMSLIFLMSVLVFWAFHHYKGNLIQVRLDTLYSNLIVDPKRHWAINIYDLYAEIKRGEIKALQHLPLQEQKEIRAFVLLSELTPQEKEKALALLQSEPKELARWIEYVNRVNILYDTSDRLTLFLNAWSLFRENPWFGIGIGNYRVPLINANRNLIEISRYPHNILLEISCLTGLFGLFSFIGILLIYSFFLKQTLIKEKRSIFLIGYCIFVFMCALASGDIYDFRIFWYQGLIILICFKK